MDIYILLLRIVFETYLLMWIIVTLYAIYYVAISDYNKEQRRLKALLKQNGVEIKSIFNYNATKLHGTVCRRQY